MSGDVGTFSECEVKTLMTPDHTTFQRYRSSGIDGVPGKALTRDATRKLRFDVHVAGRLDAMVFFGRTVDVKRLSSGCNMGFLCTRGNVCSKPSVYTGSVVCTWAAASTC